MGRLDGKVALISGAARGQGAAEGRLFAKEGAKVVLGDVLHDEGKAVAAEIGDAAMYVPLDVTSEEAWGEAVQAATSSFGRLDVLINNAGIARAAPLEATSLEDYMAVINVNQVGVFLGMKAAIPAMRAAGGGSIINISSIDGMVGMSMVVGYVSSKFAVRGMTKVAALELASSGIRVNSIHPGFIDTDMTNPGGGDNAPLLEMMKPRIPFKRAGTSEEVATLALFLASDDSSYCSGSEFIVDGAFTAGISLG